MHRSFHILALCLGLYTISSAAQAQIYITPAGASTGGGSVNAEADFTLKNGQIVLVLKNLLSNPTADSQLINGISFDVSGSTASGALITVNSGNISTISKGGAYTAGVSDPLTSWDATETGKTISLTTLTGGKPDDLIIGPDNKGYLNPTLGGTYANANPSILQHNPSVLGMASFTLDVSGVTAASKLGNVVFDFGTASGSNTVQGILSPGIQTHALEYSADVPEPGTVALFASLSLTGATFLYRRRKRHCPAAN